MHHTHTYRYYGTLPNPVKSTAGVYKNQPGKIENFLPGHSSVSEKERKDVSVCVCAGRGEF